MESLSVTCIFYINGNIIVLEFHSELFRFLQNTSFTADITAHSPIKGVNAGMNSPFGKCEENCCLTVEYELGDGTEKAELVIYRLLENIGIVYKVFSRRGL